MTELQATATPFEPIAERERHAPPPATIDPNTERNWFGRLSPVLLAHKGLFLSALALMLIGLITSVAAPAVLGFAINDALSDEPLQPSFIRELLANLASEVGLAAPGADGSLALEVYAVALLAIGLLRIGAQASYRYNLYRTAYHIEADLRSILYGHLTRLSFSFFDRAQSGQLISRANSDIRAVQMFLTFAPLMLTSWLSFALALSFMLSVHVGLTLAAVFALPGVFLVGIRMRRLMFPLSWINQSRMADLATVVDESINGIRVVKAFAAQERQVNALARSAQRVLWAAIQMVEMRAKYGPLMENIARLGPAGVLLYGGYLVMDGSIEGVGTLVTFNMYMLMLQAPFRILGFFITMSQRAAASAHRIFEILDEPVEIDEGPDAQVLSQVRGDIAFTDVHFGYAQGAEILKGLSLRIAPGETVALVGRTGCGKSTVARLLARFYDATQGSVSIDGKDVRDLTLTSLRGQVGLALEEPFLFSMSVRDNIAYGRPDATLEEVEAAAQAAQADRFIRDLEQGYDTVIGERGYTLSGGQRQRIALARLLLLNPPILVLDDATSAIDVGVEAKIHKALGEAMKDRTTLVIAHRESTIGLADRVVLIDGGQAIASGTHRELLASEPRYREVLAQQDKPKRSAPPKPQGRRVAAPAPGGPGGGGPGGEFPGGGGGFGGFGL